jgi:hypothetical protein
MIRIEFDTFNIDAVMFLLRGVGGRDDKCPE